MSPHTSSTRLHPIPCGAVVLLVPEFNPAYDERIVRPTRRRRGGRRA
jgi:hypothetical protein